MSLFVLSCKDGWVNIMYDGLDAVGVNQQASICILSAELNDLLQPQLSHSHLTRNKQFFVTLYIIHRQ